MKPTVLIIGTLDTKGEELSYLRDEIEKCQCHCLVMDVGVLGRPAFQADICREDVITRGGGNLEELMKAAEKGSARGSAIDIVTLGGAEIAKELLAQKVFDGAISIGGGGGTTIGTAIMRELPLGVPKVQVSTLLGSPRRVMARYIGNKDIMMLNSVVDIVGLNRITRVVLQEAAGAIAGMVKNEVKMGEHRPCVAITCLGVTTPMVMKVRQHLVDRGREVVVLHKRTPVLEELVAENMVEAILDLTPNELVDIVVHPGSSETPSSSTRLKRAREAGIPIIFAPGGLDMILAGAPSDVPEELKTRKFCMHNPHSVLVRTSEDELRAMGKYLGETINLVAGPVGVVVPLAGLSAMDREGSDFHDAAAIASFLQELNNTVADQVEIKKVQAHINSDEFVNAVCEMFERVVNQDRK